MEDIGFSKGIETGADIFEVGVLLACCCLEDRRCRGSFDGEVQMRLLEIYRSEDPMNHPDTL